MASSEYELFTVMSVYAHRVISWYACCCTRGHNGTRNLYTWAINGNGIRVQQCMGIGAKPYPGRVTFELQIRREGEGASFLVGPIFAAGLFTGSAVYSEGKTQ